jgi:hypothetical protein
LLTHITAREQHRLEDKKGHLLARAFTALMTVEVPEIAFVDKWEQRMDMQKILLHKLIENRSRWYSKTSLGFEVVYVLRHNILKIGDGEEWVVRVCNVSIDCNSLVTDPKGHLCVSQWIEALPWYR